MLYYSSREFSAKELVVWLTKIENSPEVANDEWIIKHEEIDLKDEDLSETEIG